MFIHDMPIWATSKDCPFGTFKRGALSLSPSSWVTVALLWPSLLHLSRCQDSSFIYRKAFTQINTATQQLPCMHTHIGKHGGTRRCILCTSTLQDFGLWSENNKTRLFWVWLFVWFLSFSFVDCSRSTHLTHFSHTSILMTLLQSSIFPLLYPWESIGPSWRACQSAMWGGEGREES